MKIFSLHIVVLLMIIAPLEMTSAHIYVDQSTKPTDKKEITIYPNPVEDEFQLSDQTDITSIRIYNIPGKEVKNFKVKNNEAYSISDLQSGIYIVRLFNAQNEPVKVLRLDKR